MSRGLGWLVTQIRCNLPKNKKMQELHTTLFQCYSKHITPEQLPSFEQWCRDVVEKSNENHPRCTPYDLVLPTVRYDSDYMFLQIGPEKADTYLTIVLHKIRDVWTPEKENL